MNDSRVGGERWLVGLVAMVAGPGAALLHEVGGVPFVPAATLWPILLVVVAATAGIVVAVRIVGRGPGWLRWFVAIPNTLVLIFYAFLLVFFGLGGSR